jgi:hypothetical protein
LLVMGQKIVLVSDQSGIRTSNLLVIRLIGVLTTAPLSGPPLTHLSSTPEEFSPSPDNFPPLVRSVLCTQPRLGSNESDLWAYLPLKSS